MKNTQDLKMIKREIAERKEYKKNDQKRITLLTAQEKKMMTPLYVKFFQMCMRGDLEELKNFISSHPFLDVNYQIPNRLHQANTAAQFALAHDCNNIVQYLIEKEGAIINHKRFAMNCVFHGNLEMLRYLFTHYEFDRGDNPPILNEFPKIGEVIEVDCGTNELLNWACRRGFLEIVKYLLTSPEVKHHADIHRYSDEPIKSACIFGHLDIVKYLLESPDLEDHANIYAEIDHGAGLRSMGIVTNGVKGKTMGYGHMHDIREQFIWEIGNLPHEHFVVQRYKVFKVLQWLLSEFYDSDKLSDWFAENQ